MVGMNWGSALLLAGASLPDILGNPVTVVSAIVIILLMMVMAYASRYRKVGPNEVMVISGRKHDIRMADGRKGKVGFRIVHGGGTFIWPVLEKVDILSLELMTLDVKTPEVYTMLGVPVMVDGVAQIKVRSDSDAISTASQQLLSKGKMEVMNIALMTVEGHLRAILGTLTVEQIYRERDMFAQKVQEMAAGDMANMGLQIVSFTIRDIRDNQGYLDALGKPRTAQVKRDAIIGQAEADRDATIKSAEANMSGQQAKFAADTKVAESNRDYQMKVQEYQASVNEKKAQADLAYDLQRNRMNQAVKKEEIGIEIVERERRIELQEKEIARKEKELDATVKKPAEAEYFKIEKLATAERERLRLEAEGRANAVKAQGFAEADVVERTGQADGSAVKARGLASADVIRAQGLAEAEAMRKKAESWALYNQAAIVQMIVENLPQLAKAVSEPLSKTERIVIIGGGNGDSAGASKITKDVINIVAQMPAAIEALTGMKLEDLINRVPDIRGAAPSGGQAESGGQQTIIRPPTERK